MTVFDEVVDEYDAYRPAYPDGVYDALGPLNHARVVELGAGTGIATRQLRERGASLVALDAGPAMLAQNARRSPGLHAAVGDGGRLPLRDACADLICCAQSWHWMPPETRVIEAHRVLADGGRWSAWWSQVGADDEAWFDEYASAIENACDAVRREQAVFDWGTTITPGGLFDVGDVIEVPWTRVVSVDHWLADQSTHSWMVAMPASDRDALLQRLDAILSAAFTDGEVRVPFVTSLWIATKR